MIRHLLIDLIRHLLIGQAQLSSPLHPSLSLTLSSSLTWSSLYHQIMIITVVMMIITMAIDRAHQNMTSAVVVRGQRASPGAPTLCHQGHTLHRICHHHWCHHYHHHCHHYCVIISFTSWTYTQQNLL